MEVHPKWNTKFPGQYPYNQNQRISGLEHIPWGHGEGGGCFQSSIVYKTIYKNAFFFNGGVPINNQGQDPEGIASAMENCPVFVMVANETNHPSDANFSEPWAP